MSVNRREFLATSALASGASILPRSALLASPQETTKRPYGSGHFGEWIQDEFGLPAFRYTCDQAHDPKAKTEVNPGILGPTEHIHQVGNERIVAIASNYGTVRVRQDEGAPKFLNDYAPESGQFAGGFGYLCDGKSVYSTFYPGNAALFERLPDRGTVSSVSFDRIFGLGYFRRKLRAGGYDLDQLIFAPFGDDPVLVSQVIISSKSASPASLRWIEYWGCQLYQFSFRSFMESFSGKNMHELRRDFAERFRSEEHT